MAYSREKQIAIEAVTLASELCNAVRTEIVGVGSMAKDDRSPVTIADFGAQAVACRRLRESFPDDPIVGEEDSAELRKSQNAATLAQIARYVQRFANETTLDQVCDWIDAGNGQVTNRFWTLDPIDGTKGFLRNDQYAVALALIEGRQVQVAALGCPALPLDAGHPGGPTGVLFVAVRGAGAWMAPLGSDAFAPIRVMQAASDGALRLVQSVESSHGNSTRQEAVARAVGIAQPALRMDSQAKYGAVARGDAALYLRLPSPKSPDYREKIWDHAAGALIVEEAGGRVTDMHGRPLDFASDYRMVHNRGIVASQGALHAAAIEALKA